ncbi:MAG: YHS domain-containing protein [Candidatus Omnitrophica bacterium]|nr:YHS domain-containing protein [Candidatus Omnitrophota bacterium]
MGTPIDESTKVTYEYNGKIYNFCCPMCVEEFKKDPVKYIK